MAFITLNVNAEGFSILFGRNEDSAYLIELNVTRGVLSDDSAILMLANGGIVRESVHTDDHGAPLFIARLEKPANDTATIEQILDFYEDICKGTAQKDQWPEVVQFLGRVVATSETRAGKNYGVLHSVTDFVSEKPQATPFVEMADDIDFMSSLSCTRSLNMPDMDPTISTIVDHQFFANQVIQLMLAIATRDNPESMDDSVDKLMEQVDNGEFEI